MSYQQAANAILQQDGVEISEFSTEYGQSRHLAVAGHTDLQKDEGENIRPQIKFFVTVKPKA